MQVAQEILESDAEAVVTTSIATDGKPMFPEVFAEGNDKVV